MALPVIVGGQTKWAGGRDEEGHRTYKLYIQTVGTLLDGPAQHLQAANLPIPGSIWVIDNDFDPWAWCDGSAQLTPREERGNTYYDHVYTYTTKPRGRRRGQRDDRGDRKKCADVTIQDPLAEPAKTSGGAVRNTEEFAFDLFGNRLVTTSFQPLIGPAVEFDRSRGQVIVEFNDVNYTAPDGTNYQTMVDTVSVGTLWGLPERCWKLSDWHWDRKLYGSCLFYYTHRFTFESNVKVVPDGGFPTNYILDFATEENLVIPGGPLAPSPAAQKYSGWDHLVPDFSTVALHGSFIDNNGGQPPVYQLKNFGVTVPDPTKPFHYNAVTNLTGTGKWQGCLSGSNRGQPAVDPTDELIWYIKVYPTTDFLAKMPRLPASL